MGVEQLLHVPVKRGVVKLFGKDGSGKTSLKESFKRLKFNQSRASTPALEIETIQQNADRQHWQVVGGQSVQQLLATFMSKAARDQER